MWVLIQGGNSEVSKFTCMLVFLLYLLLLESMPQVALPRVSQKEKFRAGI